MKEIIIMKFKLKIVNFFAIALIVGGAAFAVSINAGATVSFVKSEDSGIAIDQISRSPQSIIKETHQTKSHAPEPSTLALIGSGLLSMLISFARRTYFLAKRVIDLIGSIVALIALSPLLLLTAIIIKLTSRGPIVYTQIRVGRNGKHFKIYKFRTMTVDAEKHTGPVWAVKNDNRLTPIGGFLRKTRIDEIPQFINVLMGDMSIVGPRPERPLFVEQFKTQITDYDKRLHVKPGITGMAQVRHRYDETIRDVQKKIKYDVLYIKNICFWTDLSIILRTFRVVFTGAGAK